jgi:3-phenylpropionate/cinnamic acid dioxygenase small subunit
VSDHHEQIRNLLGRYCELMDAADWDGVGALFAHARLTEEHGHLVAEGADGVRALYEGGTQLHDGRPGTRHTTVNSVIELDDGERSATVRSSYVVFQAAPDLPLQPIIAGRYRDRFERADGGWRFTERCFFVDQVGDLSHHLTYELRP